jgi:hypothetical protein
LIGVPAGALCASSFNFNVALVDPSLAYITAAIGRIVGAAISWIVIARHPRLSGSLQLGVTVAVIGALYAYGALFVVDINLDGSPASVVRVAFAGKHEEQGKSGAAHYLDLPAWSPRAKATSVAVARATYDSVHLGDIVCILLHPGALGIAWYEVPVTPGPSGRMNCAV